MVRGEKFLNAGIVGAALFATMHMALGLRFSMDEFTYAHASWLIAQGHLPYRDFALLHPPLVEILIAPLFLLMERSVSVLLVGRVIFAAVFFGSVLLFHRWSGNRSGMMFLLAIAFGVFPTWMTELRPDSLALFLSLLAIWAVDKERILLGAVLLGLAAFTSEKVAIYGLALPIGMVWHERDLRNAFRFSVFAFIVACICYALTAAAVGIGPLFEFWLGWEIRHEREYLYRGAWSQLAPEADAWGLYSLLALAGIVACFRKGMSLVERMLLCLLVLGFASYAIQRGPYAYSLLPFVAPLVYFAAKSAEPFLQERSTRILGAFIIVALLILAFRPIANHESNREQIVMLNNMERLVPPGVCVYDNTGTAVNRPHARFFFFTDALMRKLQWNELEVQAPKDIVKKGCTAMIIDRRFFELPPALQTWLRNYFPHCDGDLCLNSRG